MKRATRSNQKSPTTPPSKRAGKKRPLPPSPSNAATPPTKTRRGKASPSVSEDSEPSTVKATRSNRNNSPPTTPPAPAAKNNSKKSPAPSSVSPALSRRSNRSTTASPAPSSVTDTSAGSPQPPKTPSPGTAAAATRATRSNPAAGRGRNKGLNTGKDSPSAASSTSAKETSVQTKDTKALAATKSKQKRARPASSEEENSPSPASKPNSKLGQSRKPKKKKRRQTDANVEKSNSDVDNSDDASDIVEEKQTGKTRGASRGKGVTASIVTSESVVPSKQRRKPQKAQGSEPEAAEINTDCVKEEISCPDTGKPSQLHNTSTESHTNGSPVNGSPKNKSCIGNEQLVLTKIDDALLNNSNLGLDNVKETSRSRESDSSDSVKTKRESSKRRLSNGSSPEAETPNKKQSKRLRAAAQSNGVEAESIKAVQKKIDTKINVKEESSAEAASETKDSVVNGVETVHNGSSVNGVQQRDQNGSLAKAGAINNSSPSKSPAAKISPNKSSPAKATRSSSPNVSSPRSSRRSGSSRKDVSENMLVSSTASVENTSSEVSSVAEKVSAAVTVKPADIDMVTDIELLLRRFGLNDAQSLQVLDLQPAEERSDGSVSAAHLHSLVHALLKRAVGQATSLSAPRCNRLLRQLLDHYCSLEEAQVQDKHKLCQECVSWARESRRTALCQELEVSLMTLYASTGHWRQAEQTATALYATTRHMQDKEKTVKACLCLSQSYYALSNLSKARAFITTAKTEALKMYTPPDLQAQLDLQSGILQVAEGKDLETAISYFKEAASGSPQASARSRALKYLVLGCLLQKRPNDAHKTARSPTHLADLDEGVLAMLAVADSAATASVKKFRAARDKYKAELEGDPVIAPELDKLYIDMMEKNILNIILPYDRVQIAHVAERIELPREEVERRLSQMILDGSLSGQLDHRDHCLYLYPSDGPDPVYEAATDTIAQLEKTIVHLSKRAKKLL